MLDSDRDNCGDFDVWELVSHCCMTWYTYKKFVGSISSSRSRELELSGIFSYCNIENHDLSTWGRKTRSPSLFSTLKPPTSLLRKSISCKFRSRKNCFLLERVRRRARWPVVNIVYYPVVSVVHGRLNSINGQDIVSSNLLYKIPYFVWQITSESAIFSRRITVKEYQRNNRGFESG